MSEHDPVAAGRRFRLPDDPERPPRPTWAIVSACLVGAVVVAGVVIAVVRPWRGTADRKRPAAAPTRLRAGHPLPGETSAQSESLRVLGPAARTPATISRHRALLDYDRSTNAISRSGRKVMTELVTTEVLADGTRRRAVVWIVSVWFHPASSGGTPRHLWCVDHGFIDARTGSSGGHVYACPLPVGSSPRAVA